jgi:hypothetical protein
VKKELCESVPVAPPAVLFLGSSMTNRGVYTDAIERTLRQRGKDVCVFNFAVTASYPLDQLLLLDNAVKNGVQPTLVVCEVNPLGVLCSSEFGQQYSKNIRNSYNSELAESVRARLLGQSESVDWASKSKELLNRYSYLIRFRRYLKSLMQSLPELVFNTEEQMKVLPTASIRGDVSKHGFGPMYGFIDSRVFHRHTGRKTIHKELEETYPVLEKVDVSHLQDSGLISVANYCHRMNIPLVFLWLPHSERFTLRMSEKHGLTPAQWIQAYNEQAKRCDTRLIDMHDAVDDSKLANETHLNLAGALQISDRIADELSTMLAERGGDSH